MYNSVLVSIHMLLESHGKETGNNLIYCNLLFNKRGTYFQSVLEIEWKLLHTYQLLLLLFYEIRYIKLTLRFEDSCSIGLRIGSSKASHSSDLVMFECSLPENTQKYVDWYRLVSMEYWWRDVPSSIPTLTNTSIHWGF